MSIQLVDADIVLQAAGVTAQGFSSILFATRHNFWPERVKTFTSTAGLIAAGVPSTHPAYKALEGAFRQSPAPTQVKVGRFTATSVITPNDAVESKEYRLTLNAKDAAAATDFTFTAPATPTKQTICDGLKAAIDAVTDIAAKITTTVVGTGDDAVLQLSHVDADEWFIVSDLVNVTESFLATPERAAPEEMAAIRAEDDDFYWFTSDVKNSGYVVALSDYLEGVFGEYAVSLAEADAYSSALTGTFYTLLEVKQPQNTYAFYHHEAAVTYPEVATVAESVFAQTGRITYANRIVNGVGESKRLDGSNLDASDLANLNANKVNYFAKVKVSGSARVQRTNPAITVGGKVCNGLLLETIVGTDSMTIDFEVAGTNLLLAQKNSRLTFGNKDLAKVRATIAEVLNKYADESQHNFIYPVNDPDFGYVINIPDQRAINAQDKLDNILKQCTFVAYLKGSVHKIKITGSLAN